MRLSQILSKSVLKFAKWYWLSFAVFMCFYFYFSNINRYRDSMQVSGVVVENLWDGEMSKKSNNTGWYPQFEFVYQDSLYTGADRYSESRTGDKVTVIFRNGDPGNARVYNFFRYWFSLADLMLGVIIAGFFYLVVVVVDQYNLHLKDEKRRRERAMIEKK